MREKCISVPNIADGNPSAAMAWAKQNESEPPVLRLRVSSWLVEKFHRGISDDPEQANTYTQDSEAKRVGVFAMVYALAAFAELSLSLAMNGGCRELTIVQEHQVMLASHRILKFLGVGAINILVPDVYPKDSAVRAANRLADRMGKEAVTMTVWNQEAYRELNEGDNRFETKETEPWLLNLAPGSAPGVETVLKASGSGMPKKWEEALIEAYRLKPEQVWTPLAKPGREDRIKGFYGSLGSDTRYIIGYPSELVQVVASLNSKNKVKLVALPPRGAHELKNLEWAISKGFVVLPPKSIGIDRALYQIDVSRLNHYEEIST
jgi:hypothetical protein